MDEYEVGPDEDGTRLDVFVAARHPDVSRTEVARQIKRGHVVVSDGRGRQGRPGRKLETGDRVRVALVVRTEEIATPEPIPLAILHEDDDLIAIDKPAGLTMHPARHEHTGTLANALVHHFRELSTVQGPARPGIVHRLDRETSGVVLVAKHDAAHVALADQFRARTVRKEYHAVVRGVPDLDGDRVDAPLGPHRRYPTRRAIRLDVGKAAQTEYRVVERFPAHAYLRCHPRTGRTHQIRVHLAHVGLPIVGDKLYRGYDQRVADVIDRHALHARAIEFEHPTRGERLRIESPLPADFEALLTRLRG